MPGHFPMIGGKLFTFLFLTLSLTVPGFCDIIFQGIDSRTRTMSSAGMTYDFSLVIPDEASQAEFGDPSLNSNRGGNVNVGGSMTLASMLGSTTTEFASSHGAGGSTTALYSIFTPPSLAQAAKKKPYKIDDDNADPSLPVGSRHSGQEPKYLTQNEPANISGRDYSGHALDRMRERGLQPSAVEDAIKTGTQKLAEDPGKMLHYSPSNNITVVTDAASGRVVTVRFGAV